jgi:hypothetical protein
MTSVFLPVANWRATASMPKVPLPGTTMAERALYTPLSRAEMSRITRNIPVRPGRRPDVGPGLRRPAAAARLPGCACCFGRYLAFGLIALPLAWLDRPRWRSSAAPTGWRRPSSALVGNLLYYLFLASAIQRAGGPLPTMIIGTLPVVIAISSQPARCAARRPLPWLRCCRRWR